MRALVVASIAIVSTACNAVDPLLGSFNFVLTGSDTQTAPGSGTSTPSGTGTLAVTAGKTEKSYVVTIAQLEPNTGGSCTLTATKDPMEPLTATVTAAQTCRFEGFNTTVTGTMTSGSLKVDTEKGETATLSLSYTFAGTFFGVNFAGNGMRTYTGARF
jgi:hypothetical protein